MTKRIEHTPEEASGWKLHNTIQRLWYWLVLLVCAPTTLYLGFQGIASTLNNIRDWWHYKEPAPTPDAWLWILIFIAAGLGWAFSSIALNDRDEGRRFNQYVRERRATEKKWEEERNRELTRWDKVKNVLIMIWLAFVVSGLIAVALKGD